MNIKEGREEYMKDFGRKKGEREICNIKMSEIEIENK